MANGDRLTGRRVLIVEDEFLLAEDLSQSLTEAGAEIVGPVGTIHEAQQKLAEGAFDCAVLDVNLRGDFTFGVAGQLRDAGVPFIVATGYGESSIPECLRDVPRVEKPFAIATLIDILARSAEPESAG